MAARVFFLLLRFICGVVFSNVLFGNHIAGMRELITLLIVFVLLMHIAL